MALSSSPAERRRTQQLLIALITRLHFYVGLFVGPFLLVAALSGIAYALTPQLEDWLYHDALTTENPSGTPQPLARQIEAAQRAAGSSLSPAAVRPAPEPGTTTRVMFAGEQYGPSENRAVFVDPVTLAIRGDMTVYGTSGVLPLRTALDQFHRGLLLGDVGRIYSELAASWLWVAALGGVFLWWQRRRGRQAVARGPQRMRQRHATLGVVAMVGLLFFSATGLTWSQWAGGNIAQLRHAWGWGTPSVSAELTAPSHDMADAHAEHHGATMARMTSPAVAPQDFDRAYRAARATGIDAGRIEMIPPVDANHAWQIREVDRSWPTQVDQVALDPNSMAMTDRADFADYPLAAKLTRWGIDLHMGILFGLPNQLALIAFASALATLICWGYVMWWRRRPLQADKSGAQTLTAIFRRLPWRPRMAVVLTAVALGYALPVMGASLALFVAIDWARWRLAEAASVTHIAET